MRPSSLATAEEILTSRARREPLRPVLGWHERMVLLGRFADIVAGAAATLGGCVPAGGVVGLVMSDTPGVVNTTLAAWRAGATVAPVDHRLEPEAIARRFSLSAVAAVIAHEEHLERTEAALRAARSAALLLVSRGSKLVAAGRPGLSRPVRLPTRRKPSRASAPSGGRAGVGGGRGAGVRRLNEVAYHAYTEGTGGELRAAVLSHANVVSSALRISAGRGDSADDVALATHPTHEVAAFVFEVLSRLLAGGAVVLQGRPDVARLVEQVEQHRVTDVSLAAGMLGPILEGARLPRRALRSVRRVLIRDVTLPMTVKRLLAESFPGAELLQSYGKAETTDGFLLARHEALFRKPATLGVPHPGLVVAIVDDRGHELRPGQRGEIACRGAIVMRGYHQAPRATRDVLRDGWLRTGDLGYIDADGEIELVGERRRNTVR